MEKKIVDVDLLVANYNNAPFLETFFRSVIESTVWPRQLIIVNDGSRDDSESIILKYSEKYKFIKPILYSPNRGFANALNEGINYLTSPFTIRVDPDDYIFENRIEKQYNSIVNSLFDVLGSNVMYFDSDNFRNISASNVSLTPQKIIQDFKNGSCGVIHGSTIIKTEYLKKFKYNQNNVPAEDFELFSRIIINGGKVGNMPDVLTGVRVHVNSVSNSLPFTTIQKTFNLCTDIWQVEHSKVYVWIKYIHMKYYRMYLFERVFVKKYLYLFISALMCPLKVIKRII